MTKRRDWSAEEKDEIEKSEIPEYLCKFDNDISRDNLQARKNDCIVFSV